MLTKLAVPLLVLMLLGVLFLTHDMKDAYKLLPINENPTMEVPPFADWREFTAKNGKFKVQLPDPPQYAKESVPIPGTIDKFRRYEMYVSEQLNSVIFMISLISYPEGVDIQDSKQLLHDLVDEMKRTKPDNKLIQIKDTTFQNYPATDFSIENSGFHVEGRAFLMDRTVYLLTNIAKRSDYVIGDYEHFIKSFELLDPKKEVK